MTQDSPNKQSSDPELLEKITKRDEQSGWIFAGWFFLVIMALLAFVFLWITSPMSIKHEGRKIIQAVAVAPIP